MREGAKHLSWLAHSLMKRRQIQRARGGMARSCLGARVEAGGHDEKECQAAEQEVAWNLTANARDRCSRVTLILVVLSTLIVSRERYPQLARLRTQRLP